MISNDEGDSLNLLLNEMKDQMAAFNAKRMEYNEMNKNDTFHIDDYERAESVLLIMNGIHVLYEQNRTIIELISNKKT